MAEVDTSAIDSQFTDGSSTPEPVNASDIFDQARDHYFKGAQNVEQQNDGTQDLAADEVANDEAQNEETNETVEDTSEDTNESDFKPYEFKGSVFGKEVAKSFDSPEELNKTIARGLASETIYKKLKERDNQINELKARAESGDEFESMAKTNPRELIELIFDKYMGQEKTAELILEKFEHFRELSRMSPEEREKHEKLQLADRLIKEKKAADEAAERVKAQQRELEIKRELEDEKNWANLQLRRMSAKYDKLEQSIVREQILNVIAIARLAKQQGNPMTQQQMSAKVAQYLKPFEKLSSPSETRRKLGEAADQRKKQATTVVQNAARGQATQATKSQLKQGQADHVDIFDEIKKRIASGAIGLK